MAKTEKSIFNEAFIKMFKAVGLDWDIERITEHCKQDGWYSEHSWTKEQEKGFTNWLDTQLKQLGWNAKTRKREIGMFLLTYGWKTT